jgi:hypothetical protein
MKTRKLHRTDVELDLEHRTDGWYYRITDQNMEFLGPYTLEGLSEQFADVFLIKLRWVYEIFYQEAPR